MIKKISHLGMAVKALDESRKFYEDVFGVTTSDPIVGGGGTIHVSMIPVGEVHIELLQPVGSEGVMAKFLEKRGEGFHHICYEVDDIYAEIDRVIAQKQVYSTRLTCLRLHHQLTMLQIAGYKDLARKLAYSD